MIARIWRGWAPKDTAADYERHYATDVAEHLKNVTGFRGARLLRQEDGEEIMFTSITFFESLDAVRGFAGERYDYAVLEDDARRALSHWDERVQHQQVAVDLAWACPVGLWPMRFVIQMVPRRLRRDARPHTGRIRASRQRSQGPSGRESRGR